MELIDSMQASKADFIVQTKVCGSAAGEDYMDSTDVAINDARRILHVVPSWRHHDQFVTLPSLHHKHGAERISVLFSD
jgi:hypothetical protein